MDRTFQGQDPEGPECQVASYYTCDEEERTSTTSTRTSESGDPSSTGRGTSQSETKRGKEEEEEESMGQKKVKFNDVVCLHIMHTWTFASRQARERYWEYFVWDRQHFQARIRKFEPLYKSIKGTSHRQSIHL